MAAVDYGPHPLPVEDLCKQGRAPIKLSASVCTWLLNAVRNRDQPRGPCVTIAASRAAKRCDSGRVEWWASPMQAVLCCGAKHTQQGVSEHEPAAELLDTLRQLQRTAADRPPCWALLCAEAANALPRLVHGALTWCTPARLPALQLIATALGAKGHSKGCVLRAHSRTCTTRLCMYVSGDGRHLNYRYSPSHTPLQCVWSRRSASYR